MIQRTLIFATATATCLWLSACEKSPEPAPPADMAADLTAPNQPVDMTSDLAPAYRYADIQADIRALTCAATGCHNATATNKLKIDLTAGQERNNYDAMLTTQMLIPGNPNTSPLIVVAATGQATSGTSHVKTLTGTKLANWTAWVQAGAPF